MRAASAFPAQVAQKEVEANSISVFEPMGEQKVKNISEPIPVYRVKVDGRALPARRKNLKSAMPAWAMSVFAIVLVLGGTVTAWHGLMRSPTLPLVATHVPSIAVLPFDDLSADKSLGYLGDGVSEDIITMLSRFFPTLSVVARNSSFVSKASLLMRAKSAATSTSAMRWKAASERRPTRSASSPS